MQPTQLHLLALALLLSACPESERRPTAAAPDHSAHAQSDGGMSSQEPDAGGEECRGDIIPGRDRCLQDDAFCYELSDGRWCTGSAVVECPAGNRSIPRDQPCKPGHVCWQFSESRRCESLEPSPEASCDSCRLDTSLSMVAAPRARACGVLGRASSFADADFDAGTAPQVSAAECIEAALTQGKPFTVTGSLQGTDSIVEFAWFTAPDGTVNQLFYDSDICGGGGCTRPGCGPRVTSTPCIDPKVAPGTDLGISCRELGASVTLCGPTSQ